ncbi:MAG: tRNA (adenosine(37)-N6)-threonylcarbamoyltransferase complex dimerization subunit type 1 TsaB [Paludibacteraceae bacterium]|jgi:tRNA threonylcarbamoyladenosine biosynthesis protein TsaB|nr:tRNA (adenosine(37)-N6)-threonylcarbamoyltransferase complex dimerization subunit type 1 TsaB [Paludibacteraceae bacterium]
MTILCIETSTQVCSAAICIGGVPTDRRISIGETNHAKLLPRYVDELLGELTRKGLRIEAVALSAGPGSYTGLRIGTSLAKGLCYGLQVPLLPIDTLQILCASAAAHAHIEDGLLCPMIDARRMEVYTRLYDADLQPKGETRAVVVESEDSLMGEEAGKKPVYYFGDGAEKCQTVLTQPNMHYIAGIVPDAQYMGLLAEQMLAEGFRGADVAYYEPFYLKQFVAAPSHVKGLK